MPAGDNYLRVLEDIAAIAARHGRDPAEISLVAVSKNCPWPQVMSAYGAGCRDFGESRVQEALAKRENTPSDVRWHFIGTLQSNKVNKVIGRFALIHSVDRVSLAQMISESSLADGCITPILLQVNVSGEPTKHGLKPEEWKSKFDDVLQFPGISVEGLMTMAPYHANERQIRHCFAQLRALRDELALHAGGHASLRHLSMGMSHDYPYAIAEGATILRIGSAIFEE